MLKKLLPLIFLLALLVTCGDDEEQSSGRALNYSGSIPRFSVDPLRDTGVELGAVNFSPWQKKFFNIVGVPNAIAQSGRIDCSSQIDFVNEAPQIYERVASNVGMDYAIQFYAQSLFLLLQRPSTSTGRWSFSNRRTRPQ